MHRRRTPRQVLVNLLETADLDRIFDRPLRPRDGSGRKICKES
jgi:hypothetical protein